MIEIKFASDEIKEEICSRLKLKNTPELKIYAAKDKDEELGYCGFEVHGKNGQIVFTSMSGEGFEMIEDGLLRSSLAYMYDSFVEIVTCKENVEPLMLRRLGFKEKDGAYELILSKSFLAMGCGCSKN